VTAIGVGTGTGIGTGTGSGTTGTEIGGDVALGGSTGTGGRKKGEGRAGWGCGAAAKAPGHPTGTCPKGANCWK
jgi:hypothetical protein